MTVTGQVLDDGVGVRETLDAVKEKFYSAKFAGLACGIKNCGIGNGMADIGRAKIVIESPNEYYVYRMPGRDHQIPSLSQAESILVKLELQSVYSDPDFVCLTYGARRGWTHRRAKKRLELVSETFDGQFYTRVYQQEWITNSDRGPKYAVVRAVPKQVVYDDETDVEVNSWGVPYIVK